MKMNEVSFALLPFTGTIFCLRLSSFSFVIGLCRAYMCRRNAYDEGLLLQQVHGVFSNHQLLVGRNYAYGNL